MKSQIANRKSQIVVVGAGTSGASLAIRLAQENFDVFLIERERFPRHKLCGEFISPECLRHFRDLGVLGEMLALGGDRISQTTFYAPSGKSVAVPSHWFGGGDALGLSRAAMDFRLLEQAKKFGVEVFEDASVVGVSLENEKIRGVRIKNSSGETREITGDLFVDATGRAGVLAKLSEKEIQNSKFKIQNLKSDDGKTKIEARVRNPKSKTQNRLVGFKTHLENVNLKPGACEIYFFRGGYGGLNYVEDNRANHCFLMRADVVKEFGGDAGKIVEQVVFKNKRAFETMLGARPVFDWLAVSVDAFGAKNLTPAENMFAVGDAAAFIDPFTGSGMLMALENAEILAATIAENERSPEKIAAVYKKLHREKFQKRLRVCSVLRRAAFAPNVPRFAVAALSISARALRLLACSTREIAPAIENKP